MSLGIPPGRALRSPSELRALVRAIRDAPNAEMERHWIEWKAAEKLLAKSCLVDIALHVIGFANREPDKAAEMAEGCAYLLIGVGPGCLASAEVIDSAQLDQGLEPYLGTDGPRYSATYVNEDGHDVLVLTVEAPRRGDRVHALRKAYHGSDREKSYAAGTIFVRKNGRTVHPPDPTTLDMLQHRLLDRNVQIDLDVSWSHESAATIVALDVSPDSMRPWLARELARLLAPVEAEENRRRAARQHAQRAQPPGIAAINEQLSRLPNLQGLGNRNLLPGGGEHRTPEAYRAEVNKCLALAEIQLPARARALAFEHVAPILQVMVTNPTDRNFRDVQVDIIFTDYVTGYVDQREIWNAVDFPSAPTIYGTDTPSSMFPLNYRALARPQLPHAYKGWARNGSGRCRIHFEPVDLRPRQSVWLPSFHLLASPDSAGTPLTGVWHATSKSADGIREGRLSISVDPLVISAATVLDKRRRGPGE